MTSIFITPWRRQSARRRARNANGDGEAAKQLIMSAQTVEEAEIIFEVFAGTPAKSKPLLPQAAMAKVYRWAGMWDRMLQLKEDLQDPDHPVPDRDEAASFLEDDDAKPASSRR